MNRILFVCSGNTCRSPMAEGIFNTLAKDKNLSAHSAGITATDGQPATALARKAAAKYGADLSSHLSRRIDESICAWADVIYCMTEEQRQYLYKRFPDLKTHGYVVWPEVPDPYGGSEADYDAAAAAIENTLSLAIGHFGL